MALVSKRFAEAANSPELLREVDLSLYSDSLALQSLASWLARHGRHIRKLRFGEDGYTDPSDEEDSTSEPLATCLQTVCAHGQLQELDLAASAAFHTDWLSVARSLRRLSLSGTLLHISPAIAGLTALQSLELDCALYFQDDAQLPASITRLADWDEAIDDDDIELPRVSRG